MASARLSRRIRAWIIATGLCVWISGVGWLIAHYFLAEADAFGPMPHPSEPWWLRLHGAFAFLAIWVGGLLWGLHAINAWGQRRRRWSGGGAMAMLLILVLTGYLLYYVGGDRPRAVISVIHWALGLALPAAYLIHRSAHKLLKK